MAKADLYVATESFVYEDGSTIRHFAREQTIVAGNDPIFKVKGMAKNFTPAHHRAGIGGRGHLAPELDPSATGDIPAQPPEEKKPRKRASSRKKAAARKRPAAKKTTAKRSSSPKAATTATTTVAGPETAKPAGLTTADAPTTSAQG